MSDRVKMRRDGSIEMRMVAWPEIVRAPRHTDEEVVAVEVFCLALAELWRRLPDLPPFVHGDAEHPHVWFQRDDGLGQCTCGMIDVLQLAEDFRARLGLRPFDVFAADARALGFYPRRSGRTTQDLLLSIATCVASGRRRFTVYGTRMSIVDHATREARRMIQMLGLDIVVWTHLLHVGAEMSPFVPRDAYVDHADLRIRTDRRDRPRSDAADALLYAYRRMWRDEQSST